MIFLLALGIGVVFLAHTAPFPFLLEAFAPSKSIWRVPDAAGRKGPPLVYLTFDDGPNPTATPGLLDVLRDQRAHATFFLIDDHFTEATAPIVRRMFEDGHAVALHSNTRGLMIQTPEEVARRLTTFADRIERLAGSHPCRLFRPHAGWRSPLMYSGLRRAGYRLAGWSWGMWDWNWFRRPEAGKLAARLAKRTSRGDIVVMHDGHHLNPAADRRYAVEATRDLIPALRQRGYEFGRLCGPTM